MTEEDEKQEELEGYRFFGTCVRDKRRQRHLQYQEDDDQKR